MTRGLGGYDHVLGAAESIAAHGRETRPLTTLDHLAELLGCDSIDVLKIDVEGMEFPVLQGAAGLLEAARIGCIILEADGHELVAFLEARQYALDPARSLLGQQRGNVQVFRPRRPSLPAS
jgi:hypothetical protein